MVFKKDDNVLFDYGGANPMKGIRYAGTVEEVEGDANNPDGYKVKARQYLGTKHGKQAWRTANGEIYPCTPDMVKDNPTASPAGFAT